MPDWLLINFQSSSTACSTALGGVNLLFFGYKAELFSITGCEENNGIGTQSCPTTGGVNVTLSGRYFGGDFEKEVFIGGKPCDVIGQPSSGSISCSLPMGAGTERSVV